MGLDQHAFAEKGEERHEIAYWRKHANLEGWMAALYRSKGGEGAFNCVEMELTEVDIDALEAAYRTLPTSGGFFWGQSDPEDDALVEAFIIKAREMRGLGCTIIYTSWW